MSVERGGPSPAGGELTNPRSARVRELSRLAKRTYRYRDRRFVAEGSQTVREALGEPGVLLELFTTAEAENHHADLVDRARWASVPVQRVSVEVMTKISQTVTPQGLIGVCRLLDVPLDQLLRHHPRLVVTLAHVRDPGNAGTVVRTADAAGADAVVFTDASVDPYNGKCVRSSAGSIFHLPMALGSGLERTVRALRAAGLRVLVAEGGATRTIDSALDEGTLAGPTAWVFGNEAWGLVPEAVSGADEAVRVPIHGRVESLNLASAASVCLYASARAQRSSGP